MEHELAVARVPVASRIDRKVDVRLVRVPQDTLLAMANDFVFPDGVTRSNVIAAIQAVGAVGNYAFADDLRKSYSLDVCCRCAVSFVPPFEQERMTYALSVWHIADRGVICHPCKVILIPIVYSGNPAPRFNFTFGMGSVALQMSATSTLRP